MLGITRMSEQPSWVRAPSRARSAASSCSTSTSSSTAARTPPPWTPTSNRTAFSYAGVRLHQGAGARANPGV